MLKFEKNVEERKELVKRLEELTGLRSVYTRAPLYAYEIGVYTVDREGCLLVEETDADQGILVALLNEGYLALPDMGGADEEEDNVDADSVPMDVSDAEYEQEIEEEAAAQMEDREELPDADAPADTAEEVETAEDVINEADTSEADGGIPLDMNFDLPMTNHTGLSLRNLVHLIYSRGPAINKATGADFHVEKGLVEALRDDRCTYTVANFLKALRDYETEHGPGVRGLAITEHKVSFMGFAAAPDYDHLTAYGHLAVLMNRMAITQKRIQAKEVVAENEKYAFRIWLLRLGMNGDEFKRTRKLLMENLEGHSAFRTKEEAERAKEKALAKRDELRAAKAAAETQNSVPAVPVMTEEQWREEDIADAILIDAVNMDMAEA